MSFAWRSIAADGQTLRYAEAGAGPVLVVLDDDEAARPGRAQELLAEGRRVLVFPPPAEVSGAKDAARRIGAALAALNVDAFDAMGHGAGAAAALWLALEHKAVRAVCLVAPLGDALDGALGEVAQPVLALFGVGDKDTPPETAGRYRTRLKDCHIMFVYDAGRAPDRDRPEAVAFITGEFLSRHDQFLVSREDGREFP